MDINQVQTQQPLTLDPPPVADNSEPLNVAVENQSPPSSPETINSRAQKFKYGLGDVLQKSKDDFSTSLAQGEENNLRATAASVIDKRKYDAGQKLILDSVNKESPLTDDEKAGVFGLVSDLNTKTNPDTVLETAYGKQFIAQLDRTAENNPGNNVLDKATMQDPEAVATILNNHGDLITKNQIVQTLLQNASDAYKNQGWFSWGTDVAKSMIPGYSDYMLRGNDPNIGIFAGGGLGQNLRKQMQDLYDLPVDEFHTKLKGIAENLEKSDPSQAIAFLQAMQGQSYKQELSNTLQLPVSVATTLPVVEGAKLGYRLTKEAVSGTTPLADVARASTDMVRAAGDPEATRSTIEAAAGDLQESAISRVTANSVADNSGVTPPARAAIESLATTYRADNENILANPGHLGQDLVNRIVEASNKVFGAFSHAVATASKVARIPDVLSNETVVRAVVDHIKDAYPGLRNTVLDVSKPYKDPVSNTHLIDLYVGQSDGTYFKNRQVAQNFIDNQGLDGTIGEGAAEKYTKASVAISKINDNIAGAQKIIDKNEASLKTSSVAPDKAQEQIDLARQYIEDQKTELNTWNAARQTARVEQQGLGYYVKVTKPIDETQPAIRQALAETSFTKLPDSPISQFFNNWIAKYRTPEEVLSKAERQNRLITTYAPSIYFKVFEDNAENIKKLQAGRFSRGRQRWEEWQRGLENAQQLADPDETGPNKKGYFFKNPAEMDTYWQQWFQRLPDEQETAAYFEFKRGMEIDRMFRNIAEHRNQQRLGAETIKLVTADADGKNVYSPEFSGVYRTVLPGAEDNILVMGNKLGDEKVLPLDRQTTKWKKETQGDIDNGHARLIEMYAPEFRPLEGFGNVGDSRVRYVLAYNSESRPLDWNHIARRGGGHIQYDYDWYIKQAKIKHDDVGNRFWYEGDTTVMAAGHRSVGSAVANHLNEVRKFLKEGNVTAAADYSNQHLHIDWDKIHSWFVGARNADGKYEPPRLSLTEDIQLVPRNTKIVDIDNNLRNKYTNFKDGTREGSLARQNRIEFTEERDNYDLLQAELTGTKDNPLYNVSPAKIIDPITMMNRGFEKIVRSNFMDDYKTMAVEHWIKQAAPYLDAHSMNEIYSSPFYYFMEGKFRNGVKKSNPGLQARLEASKYHTMQLIGQPSLTDGLLHSASQKLSDLAVNAIGPKGQVLTPTAALPFLRDPFKYVRSVAFNMKLGLFNIPQFIVQAGNYSNILGIAGYKYASPGTLGAQLHFWTRLNKHPNIINHLDSIATKFYLPGIAQWRPGEFKEAWEELNKTGFTNVRGDYAMVDSTTNNKIVTSGGAKFLDWGQTPFKLGEQNSRFGAWYTAYKEFRDANPTGRITDDDRAKILQRADLLNVNMSRASSSALNKGVWSVTTQFYSYQMRLFELFFGSRLTKTEKARMFATNALLYGVPMATGLTGLPIADWMRQKATEEGYVVGYDYLKSMLMEGLPAAIGAVVTGEGDPQAGTWYNVGDRFGTRGFEFLGNLSQSDKGYLDIIGGPVYQITKDTISQTDGFAHAMISLMHRDGKAFPMTVDDLIDPLRDISSVNTAYRDYAIANAGRWVSKNDAYLADASGWNALVSSTLGLSDQKIDDIQILHNSEHSQAEYEKDIENRFRKEFRRGLLALKNNDPEMSKKFFTRAQAWLEIGGYREDLIPSLINKALSDNESIAKKLDWSFYISKAPDDEAKTRLDAYRKLQFIKNKKGETP